MGIERFSCRIDSLVSPTNQFGWKLYDLVLHVSNDLSDQCRKKVILNVPALDNAGTQTLKEFF